MAMLIQTHHLTLHYPRPRSTTNSAKTLYYPRPPRSSGTNSTTNTTKIRMSLQESAPSIAVVGVTGVVGQEFLSVLSNRDFPYRSIRMIASKRSAGKSLTFQDKPYVIEELAEDSFDGVDIALFGAGESISKQFGPVAVEKGAIVVDTSSAFRMVDGVPLVIPEVNPEAMEGIKVGRGQGALIANPDCTTILCLMAATPLHRRAKVTRMIVNTYQADSGSGAAAVEELELQTLENDNDVSGHVMRVLAISVNLEFENPLNEDTARDILKSAPGVVVIDDRASNHFPTPLDVSKKDYVAVGRIRRDISQEGDHGLEIFVCGDKIRKGAALNAVQIAEMLL